LIGYWIIRGPKRSTSELAASDWEEQVLEKHHPWIAVRSPPEQLQGRGFMGNAEVAAEERLGKFGLITV
jgi:hypothetical protein